MVNTLVICELCTKISSTYITLIHKLKQRPCKMKETVLNILSTKLKILI